MAAPRSPTALPRNALRRPSSTDMRCSSMVHECHEPAPRYSARLFSVKALEGGQQRLPGLGGERRLRQAAQNTNGLAKLIEVGPANVARLEVQLEPRAVGRRQPVFEIVGDQLNELPARHLRQVVVAHFASLAPRWRSSALRTLERARCSST